MTKYGVLRKNYLKKTQEGDLHGLLLNGELMKHCLKIQEQAEEIRDIDREISRFTGRDGSHEAERSVEVDQRDEHGLSAGGGDHSEGADLPVTESRGRRFLISI